MGILPDFGVHAVWVWSAYGVTAIVLFGLGFVSLMALRRADRDDRVGEAEPPPVAQAVQIDDT